MSVTVLDLQPGDVSEMDGPVGKIRAMVISTAPHPFYAGLMLVVWLMLEGSDFSYSFDALSPRQVIDGVFDVGDEARVKRWKTEMDRRPL